MVLCHCGFSFAAFYQLPVRVVLAAYEDLELRVFRVVGFVQFGDGPDRNPGD